MMTAQTLLPGLERRFVLLQTGFNTACVLKDELPFALVDGLAFTDVRLCRLDGAYVMSCNGYEMAVATVEMNQEKFSKPS